MMILTLLRPFLPYLLAAAFAFGAGWSAAWYVQGLRVQSGKQDFDRYKLDQQRLINEQEKQNEDRRKITSDAWAANLDALRARYRSGWVPKLPARGAGLRLPPAGGIDASGTDTIPAAGRDAPPLTECEAILRRVEADAAATTLQLNTLQDDIARQAH